MSSSPVWIVAVTLLAPFVKKAGEKVAEQIGERLYKALESRFQKDKDKQGEQVLHLYATDPELYESSLTKYLERQAKENSSFQNWLESQVSQTSAARGRVSEEIVMNIDVKDRGEIGEIVGKVGRDYIKKAKD